MSSLQVTEDLSGAEVSGATYDLALFATGYEERARYVAELVGRSRCERAGLVGFSEYQGEGSRQLNDSYFREEWGLDPQLLSSDDDGAIYALLADLSKNLRKGTRRVLVDYSSMSRLWYSAVLNWLRFGEHGENSYVVDFVYSIGEYSPSLPPLVIGAPAAVPGFEGSIAAGRGSVAFFGLGFASEAALCVLDRLEPDSVYAFVVERSEESPYTEMVWERNEELLQAHAIRTLELPLRQVSQASRYLAELVGFHRIEADVTLVPMGPKPHVLAALLVGTMFNDAICLRVSGRRRNIEAVPPTGEVVVTRVQFS